MAEYVPRLTAPSENNRYFFADNVFEQSGYGMPNCTAYAWGRFYEICETYPKLSTSNAENWFGHADGYNRGSKPKLGAVICWRKGQAGVSSDGAGHVAIVEQINADGSIVTSESGWNSTFFWTTTRNNSNGNWGEGGSYVFQGFIYNPIDFEDEGVQPLTPISGNRFLSMDEMKINARYIWNYLGSRGWTLNAVAGMLGNMQTESTINPDIWESLNEGNLSGGYGLCQWTPATKYINWCEAAGLDPSKMDSALERIIYDFEKGGQYYPTTNYPETGKQFKVSTESPYYLGMCFCANYERPLVSHQPKRGEQAEFWFEYLSALPSPTPTRKKHGLTLLMMYLAARGG